MHTMRITAIEENTLALPTRPVVRQHDHSPTAAHVAAADLTPLVLAWSPLLFRVAHSILRSRSEAEDVVQDTFVRVLQHRAKLPQIDDPRVWLVRIAWNLALDRRRRIRPDQLDQPFADRLAASLQPADAALAEAQGIRNVLAEIDRLPAPERNVLLLSAVDELRTPEIAAILNRSESAVRALLARARARLKQRLDSSPATPRKFWNRESPNRSEKP